MTNKGTLVSTGWVSWPAIVELIGNDQCLWTDLGGLHSVVPVPPELPAGATHLWSWRSDRWVRVRIDSGQALATTLTPGTVSAGADVTFAKSNGIAWGRHRRAAQCELNLTVVRTEGLAPITFITSCESTGRRN